MTINFIWILIPQVPHFFSIHLDSGFQSNKLWIICIQFHGYILDSVLCRPIFSNCCIFVRFRKWDPQVSRNPERSFWWAYNATKDGTASIGGCGVASGAKLGEGAEFKASILACWAFNSFCVFWFAYKLNQLRQLRLYWSTTKVLKTCF